MSTISQFKPTLIKLETIIHQLEKSLGVEHKPSPFAEFIQLNTKQENEANPKQKEQPEKKAEQPQKKEQTEQKEKQPQKEKKPQQQQQPQGGKKAPAPAPQDLGPFTDFVNVDIRVGELKKVWKHEESDKLYCEEIDIGGEIRQIASGLQQFVPIEEMTGQVLVLVNLKGRKLAGFMSNGMVLCASDATHTKVELMRPAPGSKVGERVKVQGNEAIFKDEREEVLNPKKGQWEKVAPLLKTNGNLQAVFDGHLLTTSQGPIVSKTLANSNIS
ncbi:unnamed protein product (macronuclear) [Paramecium tetraurelia]|uniref:tRNA-binding domain-containing protein n=1 Tax=Paramecium tetraurelia TaxID=5888 RepID=A0EEU3_PARTE|nr:uncharacterized protein GSPATT00026157001 [Paramecium tetraurelia]CAK93834.1 unnamed protein product [Paramecium tetraurelia]|eukprot:XP_001461207.1 hypothetical protein (macronuclear) [Paramecium tetraurelia strain d4-2]